MSDFVVPLHLRVSYLLKLLSACLAGALLLLSGPLLAEQLPGLSRPVRLLIVLALALPPLLLAPWLRRVHLRSDELMQLMHQRACRFGLQAGLALMALAGLLQTLDLLPPLNWTWGFVALLACWALGLALADRELR